MLSRLVLGALACALLLPAPALAGTPATIGEGKAPHLITESGNGTAHLVWVNATTNQLVYCQVPRGAAACALTRSLTVPAVSGAPDDAFLVRRSAMALTVVMPVTATGRTYMWQSANNGSSWTGFQEVYGPLPDLGNATDPVLGPETGEITVPAGPIYAAKVNGGDIGQTADADLTGGGLTDLAVAGIPANKLVAVGHAGTTAKFWRLTGTDPSLDGAWTGAQSIPGEHSETRLASGSSGTFLMSGAGPTESRRTELRRWNGSSFNDAPIVLETGFGYINDVTVGPTGAVGAIWRRNEPSGGNRLQFALSGSGAAPYAVSTIAREEVVMSSMDVSLAGDNAGWAVYEGAGGGATSQIRLADTTAVPEPVPATPAPAPGGGTPPAVLPPATPGTTTGAAQLKKTTVSVRGASITLSAPRGCIPSGRPFVASLSWRKQRRKGNLFVKVRRTDFLIGTKRIKIDRKAPFRQTLRIPNPKKGQTYTLRARAYIKMRRGKSPTKSVRTTLRVCA